MWKRVQQSVWHIRQQSSSKSPLAITHFFAKPSQCITQITLHQHLKRSRSWTIWRDLVSQLLRTHNSSPGVLLPFTRGWLCNTQPGLVRQAGNPILGPGCGKENQSFLFWSTEMLLAHFRFVITTIHLWNNLMQAWTSVQYRLLKMPVSIWYATLTYCTFLYLFHSLMVGEIQRYYTKQ